MHFFWKSTSAAVLASVLQGETGAPPRGATTRWLPLRRLSLPETLAALIIVLRETPQFARSTAPGQRNSAAEVEQVEDAATKKESKIASEEEVAV